MTHPFLQSVEIPARHQQSHEKIIMPEVYSWLFPPVQEQIEAFHKAYPMDTFLQNIHPGLDDAHSGMFDAFTKVHPEITGLDSFEHTYPLTGSSEGIFHFIAKCVTEGIPLYSLKDEYKGYGAFIQSLGGTLIVLEQDQLLEAPSGMVFVSNPSARDGNIISNQAMSDILAKHKVFLDLAYVGITAAFDLDVSDPNIVAVVTSLSKPFGLYYYRIGMMWVREPVASLYGNRWFKNLHGILLAEKVLNHFQGSTYSWIKPRQDKALVTINSSWNTSFVGSDVALLATMPKSEAPKELVGQLDPFLRGDVYRICLTPLMMKMENQNEKP